ncbi:hypothetical protein Y032_0252g213 [Ancylostoma ceylanicum]|uniref:Uncharacterized protein n=1 Tax=Ancylostoma ceylanicum TaxID=53326 RepID=A0A016SCU9_9BILA|nr:hypothetical protein Y032_0252g213 [Ancylostoma ceylanicum]
MGDDQGYAQHALLFLDVQISTLNPKSGRSGWGPTCPSPPRMSEQPAQTRTAPPSGPRIIHDCGRRMASPTSAAAGDGDAGCHTPRGV